MVPAIIYPLALFTLGIGVGLGIDQVRRMRQHVPEKPSALANDGDAYDKQP